MKKIMNPIIENLYNKTNAINPVINDKVVIKFGVNFNSQS